MARKARKQADQIHPHVVVLYEPRSGEVKHMHFSMAAPGAELPADSVLEERAFELADRLHGVTAPSVHALHVDARDIKADSRNRVDVKTKRLINEPLERPEE